MGKSVWWLNNHQEAQSFRSGSCHMKIEKLLDFKDVIDYPSEHGDTLLLIAVKRNDVKTVKKLIELGANLNIENDWHEIFKYDDTYLIELEASKLNANLEKSTSNAKKMKI